MQLMQSPTCTNVRIRHTHDAHKIFYGVQRGLLHMVTRRLDADERLALGSGCVYAWEERGPHTEVTGIGIERFTEGRRWSPSRVRDEFLFYYEKYCPPQDPSHGSGSAEKQPPRDWDPLVKQTYSVWVDTEKGRRKWHLTAYFTQATVDQLGTVDDYPEVGGVNVPDGLFKSTRVGKPTKQKDDSQGRSSDIFKATVPPAVSRTYAPFPSNYTPSPPNPTSPTSVTPQSTTIYESYHTADYANASANYYADAQPPRYSVNPPTSPSVRGVRRDYQTDYQPERPHPPPSQNHYPEYVHHDAYGRRASLGYEATRADDNTFRLNPATNAPDHMQNHKTLNGAVHYTSPLLSPSHESHQDQLALVYASNANSSPKYVEQQSTNQPSEPWYPAPPTQPTYPVRQSALYASRPDSPTQFPQRPSSSMTPTLASHSSHTYTDSHYYGSQVGTYEQSYSNSRSSSSRSKSPVLDTQLPSLASPSPPNISLPPAGSFLPDPAYQQSYEVATPLEFETDSRRGPPSCRLAPLQTLTHRLHPYRRDPGDERALRQLKVERK